MNLFTIFQGPYPYVFNWQEIWVVVVVLGFATLLTSQVISVVFYSERESPTIFAQRL